MRLFCDKILMIVLGLHLGIFAASEGMAAGGSVPSEADGSLASVTTERMLKTGLAEQSVDKVQFSKQWIDAQPDAAGDAQWECLTEALYFEARGETVKGQFAVAEVIINRVKSDRFPGTACGVINQGTGKKYQCQFTYTCDGHKEVIKEPRAYDRVSKVARIALDGAAPKVTEGATHYHTKAVSPRWSRVYTRTTAIGTHIFYRHTWRTASN
jgi:spore germination cell wall hydrolase CwlJ-like protein